MKLTTPRLILRDLHKSDAASIAKHLSDREIAINLVVVPHPYALRDAREFLARCAKYRRKQKRAVYNFALELKSERELIGCIDIQDIKYFHGVGSLGYWVARPYQRRGLMSEALNAVLKFAFTKLKLRRINAFVYAKNKASNALIKKMRFTHEGTAKKALRVRATGAIYDENFYGLLKEDWLKRTPHPNNPRK